MSIALLTAIILGQTIPSSASVLYPCFPEAEPLGAIQLATHSATFTLDKTSQRFESVTTLRNPGSQPVPCEVRFPIRGAQVLDAQLKGYTLSATSGGVRAPLTAGVVRKTAPDARSGKNGVSARTYERMYTLNLQFKAKETKSIKLQFSGPLGRAGLDGLQKMVVYGTRGASHWSGKVGQFNCAVKYPSDLVLQVFAALPDGQWQIGPSGAFFKKYDYSAPAKPHLIFTYYPNSLEDIGGGR